ncbi:hypothetical protein BGZ57DRAFT_954121 [Hyaloscypha finlandica]|nr:hypothetical protein BGZ57DRAFT_954121 [Hyaloscypha finlandica]
MAKETKPKNTRNRADPTKSATKDQRKHEVQGKIQKTTSKIQTQRKDVETKKQNLERFSKSGIDGVAPEHKDEYKNVEEEFRNLDRTLKEYETELEGLEREEQAIDAMDVDENDGGQGLFVQPGGQSSSSTKPNGTPQVNLTEPNGKSKPVIIGGHSDDDEEEEGFTPAQAREASGQSHGGKIVAWRQQDRSKPVIVMYGPQNAAKYERSTAAREDNDFDEDETAQFGPDNRLGDVKVNKKFVRRKRELMSILGLAYNCDLDDLQPREKGEKRRLPPLEIWVKWKIDGEIKKVWEIRSSIRHLFSNVKKADTYIYDAAKWHAKRHQEWLDGQREAKDKSPTPDPNSRLSSTPEPTGTKPIKTESDDNSQPQPGPPPPESPMLKYKKQWCELKGIDPKVMDEDPEVEGRFLKAWNAFNA